MHGIRTSAFLAAVLPSILAAQPSASRISPARIDAVFKDYGPHIPGCALGIYRDGKVLYAKG